MDAPSPRTNRHQADGETHNIAGARIRSVRETRPAHAYRSVWISDFHLGSRACRAQRLLDFLARLECDTLYLVGDIIDGWALKKSWYWPATHSAVVQAVVDLQQRRRTQVVYIPGNHDDVLRDYLPIQFAGIQVRDEAVHVAGDGRRFLVVHGDALDVTCNQARWLALAGDYAYRTITVGNSVFNSARRRLGLSYVSLSGRVKARVKKAVAVIGDFEQNWLREARRRCFDGVICGHIHAPVIKHFGDVEYCNDGDWVESCSALVEHADGRLEIVYPGAEAPRAETGAEAPRVA